MARIKAMARALKASGAGGSIDLLSAQIYLGLLLGTLPLIPPPDGAPPGPPGDGPGGPPDDPGCPALAARRTIPVTNHRDDPWGGLVMIPALGPAIR